MGSDAIGRLEAWYRDNRRLGREWDELRQTIRDLKDESVRVDNQRVGAYLSGYDMGLDEARSQAKKGDGRDLVSTLTTFASRWSRARTLREADEIASEYANVLAGMLNGE